MSESRIIQFKKGQLFQHTDGGIYRFDKYEQFADDATVLISYRHVWPFKPSQWARREFEFVAKFTPITKEQLLDIKQQNNRVVFQKEIGERRAARRAKNTNI